MLVQARSHACRQAFGLTCAFESSQRARLVAGYGASGVWGEQPSFDAYMATQDGQAELQAFKDRVHARVQQVLPTQGEPFHCAGAEFGSCSIVQERDCR